MGSPSSTKIQIKAYGKGDGMTSIESSTLRAAGERGLVLNCDTREVLPAGISHCPWGAEPSLNSGHFFQVHPFPGQSQPCSPF